MSVVPSAPSATRPGLIPLEWELRERLAWFIRLRWLAAAGIFLGAWGATTFVVVGLPSLPLYGVGLAVTLYNVLFWLHSRRLAPEDLGGQAGRRFIYAQIGLDWLSLFCLALFSGCLQSPVTLAFTFHLIIGAILLSRRACYLQALLAVLLAGGLVLVWQLGILPPLAIDSPYDLTCSLPACLYRWLILSVFLGATAFLVTSIIVPLRRKEEALVDSERALEQAYQEMEALYQVGQAVNATLNLEQVLGVIAEHGARLMGMKACSIRLLEADGRHLRIGAAYGLSDAYLAKGAVEVKKSRLDAEALAGRTVQIADVAGDPRFQYPEEARREGIGAVLCVPLQAKGQSIGCMRVYAHRPQVFARSEENFLRNLANLGAVAIENARAYADLQALNEERAWFARVTHHQLRSPVSAIKSMLEALRYAGPLNDKQHEFIERGRRRVDELLELIRDLLDLAAAQRPRIDRSSESVALAACLARTLETMRDRAAHKQVHLEVLIDDEQLAVLAEAGDVERIFANLLDNALKYTPRGGEVSFRVSGSEDRVLATVADTGIGVPLEDQERIFAGFFRTEAAKETGEPGTGMGLSIVKKLVERWGGTLKLESEPGKGSRFVVELPQADLAHRQ